MPSKKRATPVSLQPLDALFGTKFTEKPRIAARNYALHDFCASRSALL